MNIRKAIAGLVAVAGLTALAAGSAMAASVTLGSLVSSSSQTITLLSGGNPEGVVDLTTSVYDNAGVYTYEYAVTNPSTGGISPTLGLFAPTVSSAGDFDTTGLTFFVGGAPSGGTVTTDGGIGNDSTNNISLAGTPIYDDAGNTSSGATVEEFGLGQRVDFSFVNDGLPPGSTDYLYVQSNTGPGSFDLNVTNSGSADVPAPGPGVPEPSSVAGLGIGLLGLLSLGCLGLRRRA